MVKRNQKVLIANRGEIACRVIRTCRSMGMSTVAVYSDADEAAMHVAMADEAVRLGPPPVSESYLRGDAIIEAALATGADAIHPGYGFLSENPEFVEAVDAAGLVFIGPTASAIRAMGLKDQAKTLMEAAGVPVVPGYHGDNQDPAFLKDQASKLGFPVLIKARAGGGGKGMRLVERVENFDEALASAAREAQASFGDPACLIEKFIQSPRHIEVQVFGDTHGNVVHLFERDCSLQRRHQKVIEEAPAPGMTETLRAAMGAAAVAAAKAVDYQGAGTVEFIVDGAAFPDPEAFWFMEMNTRLQVEHPVTEAVTGLDLVALQLKVAAGEPLPFEQDDLALTGHAFEARLYAEDPENEFLPSTGRLQHLKFADSARIDTGVRAGDAITPFYDPMISKVITSGSDRASALRSLVRALEDTEIAGLQTNRDVLIRLATDDDFAAGRVDTGLIARRGAALVDSPPVKALDLAIAALAAIRAKGDTLVAAYRHFGPARQSVAFEDHDRVMVEQGNGNSVATPLGVVAFDRVDWSGDKLRFQVGGLKASAAVFDLGDALVVDRRGVSHRFERQRFGLARADAGANAVTAPLTGRVVAVTVSAGDAVVEGQTLLTLEAMKMEHRLTAPRDGIVAEVALKVGAQVEQGAVLVSLEDVS